MNNELKQLAAEWERAIIAHDLPALSADEVMWEIGTDHPAINYVCNFVRRWEAAEDRAEGDK